MEGAFNSHAYKEKSPFSPLANRNSFSSQPEASAMEHQFLFCPPGNQNKVTQFDLSFTSKTDSTPNIPYNPHQQDCSQQQRQNNLQAIQSTPPTSCPSGAFTADPTFDFRDLLNSPWQDAASPTPMPIHQDYINMQPYRGPGSDQSSPLSQSLMPILGTSQQATNSSLGRPPSPAAYVGRSSSEGATVTSNAPPNPRKRSHSHMRNASLSVRTPSPLSLDNTKLASSEEAPPIHVDTSASANILSDASRWQQEFTRVSKELSALREQFSGLQKQNYELRAEKRILQHDLKWALGLNHFLPKIQNYVGDAVVTVGSKQEMEVAARAAEGSPTPAAINPTQHSTPTHSTPTSFPPITLPPLPAPAPAAVPAAQFPPMLAPSPVTVPLAHVPEDLKLVDMAFHNASAETARIDQQKQNRSQQAVSSYPVQWDQQAQQQEPQTRKDQQAEQPQQIQQGQRMHYQILQVPQQQAARLPQQFSLPAQLPFPQYNGNSIVRRLAPLSSDDTVQPPTGPSSSTTVIPPSASTGRRTPSSSNNNKRRRLEID